MSCACTFTDQTLGSDTMQPHSRLMMISDYLFTPSIPIAAILGIAVLAGIGFFIPSLAPLALVFVLGVSLFLVAKDLIDLRFAYSTGTYGENDDPVETSLDGSMRKHPDDPRVGLADSGSRKPPPPGFAGYS